MKTIDLHPEYVSLPDEELITSIPGNLITPLMESLSSYYDSKLNMQQVYSIYGHELFLGNDQQQVVCLLPSHGSQDRHPSARFYPVDRNTGELRHAVYCHKCQKMTTPFWLLYKRESFFSGIHMRDLFLFLKKTFQIPFPRHIYFDFDPQEYFTFTESEAKQKIQKIKYAEMILNLKEAKDSLYLSELKRFWQEL